MNLLVLALAAGVLTPQAQEPTWSETIVEAAVSGTMEDLADLVRRHPDAAREALLDLLTLAAEETIGGSAARDDRSPEEALSWAGRLARAYFDVWTDPFLIQELERFKGWSPDHRRKKLLAENLRIQGIEAFQEEGVSPAMELWRRSLSHSESMADAVGTAKSLGNMGAAFYVAGLADSARTYLTAAHEGASEVGDFRTAAGALTNLGNLAFDEGTLSEAVQLYTRAAAILSRTGEYRNLSAVQHNLGLVSMDLGDMKGARDALGRSIELSRRFGFPGDEAEALSALADVAQFEGAYGEAAELLQRALRLSRETENRIAQAGVLHSRGLLDLARGDYRGAEDHLREAESIYRDLEWFPDVVGVRRDLARCGIATGDLGQGIRELDEARSLTRSFSLGPTLEADLALVSADLHLALNDFARAMELYQNAHDLYSEVSGLSGRANALEGQGLLHLIRGDFQEARGFLSRTRALRLQPIPPDPRALSVTEMYLASVLEELEDQEGARRTLRAGLERLGSQGDPVSEAALLATLGGLELRTHRFLAADSLFARGLDLVHGRGAPEVEVRLRAGRADVLERRGNLAAAAEELRRAMALGEGVGVTLPFEDRSRLHAGRPDVYARLASILDRLGDPAEAFQVAERARAQRTLAALNGGRIEIPRGVDPALLEREQDLRMRLQDLALQMRGTGSLSRGLRESEGDPATGLSDLQALASELQGEYSNLLADLRRGAPDYLSRVEPPTRPAGDLVGLLEPHELILEYLMEDDGALVFVVTSEGISTVRMAVDESSLSDLVTFARGAIESQGGGDLAEFWRSPLRRLYRALIEPLETSGVLSGRESLIIVPHGSLHYLPFQALLDPSDDTFLIERYRVSYAPSASAWAQLRERTPPWPASGRRTDPRVLALAPKARELPGSAYEVETIGRLFGDRARVLRGESATEQAFVELAPGFDFVHLATFGRLNKINPLFSRVELSGGGSTPGFLEVHEIYGLQLKARLLTLSACETGLGSSGLWDLDPGDDWVSLASAFLGAGAANVMASLWRVEDTATATLMGEFYNQVADGWDLATSLAQAQQALIQDPTTAHPFFWAGFQLIGEGGRTP